jgi:hypothetical protein
MKLLSGLTVYEKILVIGLWLELCWIMWLLVRRVYSNKLP